MEIFRRHFFKDFLKSEFSMPDYHATLLNYLVWTRGRS